MIVERREEEEEREGSQMLPGEETRVTMLMHGWKSLSSASEEIIGREEGGSKERGKREREAGRDSAPHGEETRANAGADGEASLEPPIAIL